MLTRIRIDYAHAVLNNQPPVGLAIHMACEGTIDIVAEVVGSIPAPEEILFLSGFPKVREKLNQLPLIVIGRHHHSRGLY